MEPIIWSLCLHVIVTDKNEWVKLPEKSPKMPKTRKYLQKWATVWLLQYALLCDSVTCHVVTMVTWLSFLDAYLRRSIPHTASFWITGTPHWTTLISQFVSTLATKNKLWFVRQSEAEFQFAAIWKRKNNSKCWKVTCKYIESLLGIPLSKRFDQILEWVLGKLHCEQFLKMFLI